MQKNSENTAALAPWSLLRTLGITLFALVAALGSSACATVRPEQRAVLADPTMRFEGEPGEKAATDHVLENRESSFGGGSVRGGGCGCN
ncbi:MAG TPA: DUF4266 domain-containing protein [Polyangiaceae bacterium]